MAYNFSDPGSYFLAQKKKGITILQPTTDLYFNGLIFTALENKTLSTTSISSSYFLRGKAPFWMFSKIWFCCSSTFQLVIEGLYRLWDRRNEMRKGCFIWDIVFIKHINWFQASLCLTCLTYIYMVFSITYIFYI